METTAAFLDFVIGVACDRIAPPANTENAPTANITDPADFLRAFFAALDTVPITRTGTEYAADTVFVHPDIRAFLATPVASSSAITGTTSSDPRGTNTPPLRVSRHPRKQCAPDRENRDRMFANGGAGATRGDILSVPFKLRANDVTRHIINVDSRFRDAPNIYSPSDYYFTLLSPVRNVLRVRITSVELPNNYFFFTAKRQNVTFRVRYMVGATEVVRDITIIDGNYTADGPDGDSMVAVLNTIFAAFAPDITLTVAFSIINGSFKFSGSKPFSIDTTWGAKDRPLDYGLGYYLGYTRGTHYSAFNSVTGKYEITSDACAYFSGDNYVMLALNDFDCVRQTVRAYDTTYLPEKSKPYDFTATAKLIMSQPKNYMVYDDYSSKHIKEVVFPGPVDLARLRVRLLDAYGDPIDLCSSQYSFSIEVLEVKNMSLYNTIRDSLALEYI
jgi:hypothetical protein